MKATLLPCIIFLSGIAACAAKPVHVAESPASNDSAFVQLQRRGEVAMGVNQYTSAHRFDDLATGGQISLQRDPADTAGVSTIRLHLRDITGAFQRGDFRIPGFVHAREVPGTAVMAAKKALIQYAYSDLPGGGTVVITTKDPEAISAIHAFLAFQRQDHHAPGHKHD